MGWRANPWHGSRGGGHAGHVAHQVLGSRPVQHVVRHYAPTRSTTRIAHQVLGSRGVQHAARHGQVVLNRRAARVLRLSQRRLPVQVAPRVPVLSPTLRLATRQPSVFAQPPVQATRVAQIPHVAIPNVFHTRIAPITFRPAQNAAAKFMERSVAKVPGRARPPRFPALRHYTAGQRRYINRAVQRYGRAAARDRGYQSAGAASRAGVNLGGQIAQYGEPQAKRALAVYQPMRTPTNLKPVKPGHGVRPETVPGDGSLGGFAAVLSGGIHPVAGMSLAAAGRAVNKGFIAPSVKGTLDLAANTPGAIYNTGAAGFEALHGDFGRAKQLAHDFVNNDPIALLVQGRTHEAWKAVARNPVAATLEVLGAKGLAGRSVGRVQRAAGGSREAVPAVLEGTGIAQRRPYSRDAITRKRQIAQDRGRLAVSRHFAQQAAQAASRGALDEAKRLVAKARAWSPHHITDHQVHRRVDERVHANEMVRRALRGLAMKRAQRHVVSRRKGGALMSLLAQGIVHPHVQDIQAYLTHLDQRYRSGQLSPAEAFSNRVLAKEVRGALGSKHLNLPDLHARAKAFAVEQAAIEAKLVDSGLLDAAQAEKARLIPYAVRRMGASHNGDRIIGPGGQFLSSAAIKQHMLHNGVNPDEVAYLSQAPNARGARNFYMNTLQRHVIPDLRRTGEATRNGTFDPHPQTFIEQAAREANLLAADHGFKGLIGEFGVRHPAGHPDAGKVMQFGTKRSAQLWIDDQHAQGARGLRAVRVNPFLGKQKDLEHVIEAVNSNREVPASILDQVNAAVDHSADGAGPWAVIHDTAAHRLQQHLSLQRPIPGLRGMQKVNQAFRNAVLPLSTKWITGNVVEAAFRTALARAGPLSYLAGRRVLGELDRQHAAGTLSDTQMLEARARTVGGGHFAMAEQTSVHRGADQFEHSVLRPVAHALGAVAKAPGPRNVGNLWQHYTHFVFSANGAMERQFQTALAGRYLRDMKPTRGELALSRRAVEQAAHGLKNTNEQVQMGRFIDRAYGKYGKFNPTERALIAYYTPFIAWSLNAVKFVTSVLPKDHPVATGLLVAAQNASEGWLKDHGLNLWMKNAAPGWLQGSFPAGGGKVRAGRYLPFGFFGDPAQQTAGVLMPQYASAYLALNGLDWKGESLTGPGGGTPDQSKKFGSALEAFLGGTVPILGQVQQVATKKGPLGQKLQRQFNPFYPVQNTSTGGAAGPHDSAIDKALQNLPGGGGPHDQAIDRALKSPAPGGKAARLARGTIRSPAFQAAEMTGLLQAAKRRQLKGQASPRTDPLSRADRTAFFTANIVADMARNVDILARHPQAPHRPLNPQLIPASALRGRGGARNVFTSPITPASTLMAQGARRAAVKALRVAGQIPSVKRNNVDILRLAARQDPAFRRYVNHLFNQVRTTKALPKWARGAPNPHVAIGGLKVIGNPKSPSYGKLVFDPTGPGWAWANRAGGNRITFSRDLVNSAFSPYREQRLYARQVPIHELAHIFQRPGMARALTEGGAEAFKKLVAHDLGLPRSVTAPEYKRFTKLVQRRGDRWLTRGQFSPNSLAAGGVLAGVAKSPRVRRSLSNAAAARVLAASAPMRLPVPGSSQYPVSYAKQRLFAHPQRPGAGKLGRAQLRQGLPGPTLKTGQITPHIRKLILSSPKAAKLRKRGYSSPQIINIARYGNPRGPKPTKLDRQINSAIVAGAKGIVKGVRGSPVAQNKSHYSPGEISKMFQAYGAPKWVADALGRTSVPESGGDPTATSNSAGGGSRGLLQINPAAWPVDPKKLYNPDYNIRAALYVLSKQGSQAWAGSGTWRGPAVAAGQFNFPHPDKQRPAGRLTKAQARAFRIIEKSRPHRAVPIPNAPSNTSGIPVSTSSPGVSAGVASGKASGGKASALSGLPAVDAAALAQLLAPQQGPVLATPLQAPAFSAGAVFPSGYTAGQVSLADILQRITGRARV